jgi:hypothetical protein
MLTISKFLLTIRYYFHNIGNFLLATRDDLILSSNFPLPNRYFLHRIGYFLHRRRYLLIHIRYFLLHTPYFMLSTRNVMRSLKYDVHVSGDLPHHNGIFLFSDSNLLLSSRKFLHRIEIFSSPPEIVCSSADITYSPAVIIDVQSEISCAYAAIFYDHEPFFMFFAAIIFPRQETICMPVDIIYFVAEIICAFAAIFCVHAVIFFDGAVIFCVQAAIYCD